MKGKKDFWVIGVVLLVAVAFLMPAMAQGKSPVEMSKIGKIAAAAKAQPKETMSQFFKKERENLCSELKLSPDKAKEFMAIGDKYDKQRKDLIEQIKKNEADLKKAVAASKPDEGKLKSLVDEAVANQEKLFDTFKDQRKEEMALLDPMQQAKYLLTLMKWHRTQYERIKKKKK
jgi:Spy/CpxP family protein refolding chaperone